MLIELIKFVNTKITLVLNGRSKKDLSSQEKREFNYLMWTKKKTKMIKEEESFLPDPDFWVYKYGDVYECDLGFNLFGELGGRHYILVIADSGKKNPVVNVVPLASLKSNGDNTLDLHITEVNIGKLPNVDSDAEAKAMIGHVKTISKMRIDGQYCINQRIDYKKRIKLENEKMKMVSDKLQELFLYKT